jgi:hypothetical protein
VTAIATLALGALLGALATYFVQGALKSRDELHWLRDRMPEAADDFATAAIRVGSFVGGIPRRAHTDAEVSERLRPFRDAYADAGGRLARVDLMFGEDSETAQAGRAHLAHLADIRDAFAEFMLA